MAKCDHFSRWKIIQDNFDRTGERVWRTNSINSLGRQSKSYLVRGNSVPISGALRLFEYARAADVARI